MNRKKFPQKANLAHLKIVDSYLKIQVRIAPSEHFGPVIDDWTFNKRDRSFVRHLKK